MTTKKDSFYFTSEIIKNFADENDFDETLVKKLYYFYIDRLRESIKNNDHVAYLITHFGTLYLTVTGVNYEMMTNRKSKFFSEEREERLKKKKKKISEMITKLKKDGVKSIHYFRKIFNPVGIKNNEC